MYVFAFLLVVANFNSLLAQEKSLTELWITNPTCCPAAGTCGANHPILGPANSEPFYGNDQFSVFIGWNTQFPSGTSIVHYWATTVTVEVPDAAYNADVLPW